MLPLHVVNAKEEITRRQRINGQRRISWNLGSIADFAEDILRIKRPNNRLRIVILPDQYPPMGAGFRDWILTAEKAYVKSDIIYSWC